MTHRSSRKPNSQRGRRPSRVPQSPQKKKPLPMMSWFLQALVRLVFQVLWTLIPVMLHHFPDIDEWLRNFLRPLFGEDKDL